MSKEDEDNIIEPKVWIRLELMKLAADAAKFKMSQDGVFEAIVPIYREMLAALKEEF